MVNTVYNLLKYRADAHPERIAIWFEGKEISYSQLFQYVEKAKNYLNEKANRNERIAILDYNSLESLYIFLGARRAEKLPSILNYRLTETEILEILKKYKIKFLFCGEDFLYKSLIEDKDIQIVLLNDIIFESIESKITQVDSSNDYKKSFHEEDEIDNYFASIDGLQLRFVELFTSGTTGLPKSVQLTDENILECVQNLEKELPGFGSDSKNLVCAPFYHIGGVGYFLLGIYVGCTNILFRKFQPLEIANAIQNQKITNALLVPAMIQSILGLSNISEFDFSSLRNIQYGGSPMQESILRKAKEVFHCYFTCAYGLTEASGISTLLRFDKIEECLQNPKKSYLLQSVGKPISGTNIIIINSEKEAKTNELGEICIQSKQVFRGYENTPDRNNFAGNHFKTGDIGFIDEDGYLFLVDRKNDMILSKSENIYPSEVERFYQVHPSIKEIAIVGLENLEFGEIVTAFVVLKEGMSLDLISIKNFAEGKLAGYKVPRKLFILDSIPKNPTGKVLRSNLKEAYNKIK
ncbi:MAG: AMP-binding protein [Leptospiraceae bacterium]|nr:AMP-binding protein [Leptospiraceae bacterium]